MKGTFTSSNCTCSTLHIPSLYQWRLSVDLEKIYAVFGSKYLKRRLNIIWGYFLNKAVRDIRFFKVFFITEIRKRGFDEE